MLEIDDRLAEQRKADREAFHQEKAELLQERHAKKAELFELEQKADLASWVRACVAWRVAQARVVTVPPESGPACCGAGPRSGDWLPPQTCPTPKRAPPALQTTTWRRHRDALKNFILCQPKDDADALPIFYLPVRWAGGEARTRSGGSARGGVARWVFCHSCAAPLPRARATPSAAPMGRCRLSP